MNSRLTLICGLLLALLTACQVAPLAREPFQGPDFGLSTRGGLDGRVIKVSNLNSDGPGSMRAALNEKGPRVVVFEVGGIIDLDRQDIIITEPFVTLAGQTAPSPGITLIRGGMKIRTHDVVMQHMRIRPGDTGLPKKSDYENDVSIEGKNAWNVVVDHCSVSWGTDENLSVSGPRYNGPQGTAHKVTLSNNIIAEGLVNSTHKKGKHSMGSLIHDNVTEVGIIGNLYAHNADRNPWFKGGSTGLIINNYIYNPGKWAIRLGYNPKEWVNREIPPAPRLSIVGNVMQYGVDTPEGQGLIGSNAPDHQGEIWSIDNHALDRSGKPAPIVFGGVTLLERAPIWHEHLSVSHARVIREKVLQHAGARPADRDSVDLRLIADIRAGKGQQIDSQDDVGGYPQAKPTHRSLNIPATGLDLWLNELEKTVLNKT